jgi:hypothetical protein
VFETLKVPRDACPPDARCSESVERVICGSRPWSVRRISEDVTIAGASVLACGLSVERSV